MQALERYPVRRPMPPAVVADVAWVGGLPPVRSNGTSRRRAIRQAGGTGPAPGRAPYVEAVFARHDPRPALVRAARLVRGRGR